MGEIKETDELELKLQNIEWELHFALKEDSFSKRKKSSYWKNCE